MGWQQLLVPVTDADLVSTTRKGYNFKTRIRDKHEPAWFLPLNGLHSVVSEPLWNKTWDPFQDSTFNFYLALYKYVYIHAHTHIYSCFSHICVCVYIHAHTYTNICVQTFPKYVCVHEYAYTHTLTCTLKTLQFFPLLQVSKLCKHFLGTLPRILGDWWLGELMGVAWQRTKIWNNQLKVTSQVIQLLDLG